MRSPTVRRHLFAAFAVLAGLAMPCVAAAHPLGNFTINHYAAVRVSPERIDLDVVVDFAEIPAFQERIRIDADGDGDVSDAETDAARATECEALQPSFALTIDGEDVAADLVAAGLSFPAGAGGVPTMRVVCELRAELPDGLRDGVLVAFGDGSYAARIGWREIVVIGDGMTIESLPGLEAPASEDVSARLTTYPAELLAQPLEVGAVSFVVRSGGPAAAPFEAPDAAPISGAATSGPATAAPSGSGNLGVSPAPTATALPAAIPGGVGDIPAIFQAADLTPLIALGSIVLAMALGAGHALTPGHGKTLMAAYLVGTRGTIRHAAGLGLAVTVSHTLGILVLALLVTGAESVLPADTVVRWIPVVAALAFVAIGASMVIGEVRRRRRGARLRTALAGHDEHEHAHAHEGDHGDDHAHGGGNHDHDHDHDHGTRGHGEHGHGEHSHGGIRHSHLPADDRTLTWKGLFALGLAGGIIPSTNALIILLGTIVAGRAAFGIVLVVAFGLGMAIVLGGVGAAMVVARDRMARLPTSSSLGRAAAQAPLVASVAVLGIGLWLTAQAIGGGTVF